MTTPTTLKLLALASALVYAGGAWALTITTNDIVWTFSGKDGKASITKVEQNGENPFPVDVVVPEKFVLDGGTAYDVTTINARVFEKKAISNVVMRSITHLKEYAFSECTGLTNVVMPVVEVILNRVFQKCTALTGDYNLTRLTTLGGGGGSGYIFENCALTSMKLPALKSVTAEGVFWGNTKLTNVMFSSQVTSLPTKAFYGSYKLENCEIDFSKLTSLGGDVFIVTLYDNTYKDLVNKNEIPSCPQLEGDLKFSNLIGAGGHDFYYRTKITSLYLPLLKKMPTRGLNKCLGLTNLVFHCLEEITGDYALDGTANIKFPPSFKKIAGTKSLSEWDGEFAYLHVTSPVATNTTYGASNKNFQFKYYGGVETNAELGVAWLFDYVPSEENRQSARLLGISTNGLANAATFAANGRLEIPRTLGGKRVTDVQCAAFYKNDYLTTITLPAGVTNVNYAAFRDCKKGLVVEVSEGSTQLLADLNEDYATEVAAEKIIFKPVSGGGFRIIVR